jgi:hypothetical protein
VADLSRANWRKSTRSQANGDCVEFAELEDAVALRDSKNPSGPPLLFSHSEWQTL